MKADPEELTIRRILVALDTSTDSLSGLEAAARLAAAMRAELVGLFVEDINLLHLAMLPFTDEVQRATGIRRSIDQHSMERDLQLQASQARRALAAAAGRAEARWTFKVVRGEVKSEVLSAALEADLLTLGRTSRSHFSRPRLGSTARAAIERGPGYVILGGPDSPDDRPVMVTFDGSQAGSQALVAAAHIAAMRDSELIVLLVESGSETGPALAADLAEQCDRLLAERDFRSDYDFQRIPADQTLQLVNAAHEARCSLLVLGGESPVLQGAALQLLLDELSCPVMLVR